MPSFEIQADIFTRLSVFDSPKGSSNTFKTHKNISLYFKRRYLIIYKYYVGIWEYLWMTHTLLIWKPYNVFVKDTNSNFYSRQIHREHVICIFSVNNIKVIVRCFFKGRSIQSLNVVITFSTFSVFIFKGT